MTLAYTRDAAGTGDNVRNELRLFSLQGKSFQWRKDKGVRKKYIDDSLTNSAFNWSRSVRLWLTMSGQA